MTKVSCLTTLPTPLIFMHLFISNISLDYWIYSAGYDISFPRFTSSNESSSQSLPRAKVSQNVFLNLWYFFFSLHHMWLQDMHKHFNRNADGYDVIQDALDAMTYVAHHINEMKRKHEAAVHVQEIQSQMVGLEVSREDAGFPRLSRMRGSKWGKKIDPDFLLLWGRHRLTISFQ